VVWAQQDATPKGKKGIDLGFINITILSQYYPEGTGEKTSNISVSITALPIET
jgi:hypothetical protein